MWHRLYVQYMRSPVYPSYHDCFFHLSLSKTSPKRYLWTRSPTLTIAAYRGPGAVYEGKLFDVTSSRECRLDLLLDSCYQHNHSTKNREVHLCHFWSLKARGLAGLENCEWNGGRR
jgi:hypothetical protein